jgi:hypothetical protein
MTIAPICACARVRIRGAAGRAGSGLFAAGLALLLAACQSVGPAGGAAASGGTIERLEIRSRAPAFGGARFGEAGAYELITGVVTGRLDPAHPSNATIVDLGLAPRDADGWVTYQSDVSILRPASAERARRVILYDVVNRGRPLAHQLYFNEGGALDAAGGAGNGFLMRQGITVVWSGWQGDLPLASGKGGLLGTRFPIARGADGSPVRGMVRDEWVFDHRTNPARAELSYPVADPDRARAILQVKQRRADPWRVIDGWSYDGDRAIRIERPADMDAGAIYEFVYPARDPVVMGIGFAAIRDLVSFLRYDAVDRGGAPNPLNERAACPDKARQTADVVILEGISQSGRAVRDFVYQGFNLDTAGRRVFDAAMPLIAGSRRTWVNERFAQPGRWSKEHEEHFQHGDQFPFGYAVTTDPVSGRRDGVFARCEATRSCPKLMHVDGGAEFWQGRASLVGADGAGRDLDVPPDVRAYLMTGTPHAYAPTGKAPKPAACALPGNVVNPGATTRALLVALVDWVARDVPPPASRWPRVAAGELADPRDARALGLPDLSRIGAVYQGTHNALYLTDYGAAVPKVDLSRAYRVLVPVTDADGNDRAGVRTPDVEVPLATHLPWNPRGVGFAPGAACGGAGSTLPFAPDAATRARNGDPRPSIAERYADEQDYLRRVRASVDGLRAQRLMLEEDAQRWMERAQAAWRDR